MEHRIVQRWILLSRRLAPYCKQRDWINELLYPLSIFQLIKDENLLCYSVSTSTSPVKFRADFRSCLLRMSSVAAVKHSVRTFTNVLKLTFFLRTTAPRNRHWLVNTCSPGRRRLCQSQGWISSMIQEKHGVRTIVSSDYWTSNKKFDFLRKNYYSKGIWESG